MSPGIVPVVCDSGGLGFIPNTAGDHQVAISCRVTPKRKDAVMARHGFLIGLTLLGLSISTPVANGQLIKSAPNLVNRLNSLWKGWGWSELHKPAPPPTSQPVKTRPDSFESTGARESRDRFASLPRVDAQKLLPRYWQTTEAGEVTVPDVAPRRVFTNQKQDREQVDMPRKSSPRRTLGGDYQSLPRGAGGLMPLSRSRVGATGAPDAASIDISTSRPSPKVRRSPRSASQSDFDAETLRRELVDATGRSIPRPSKKPRLVEMADKSAVPPVPANLAAIADLQESDPEVSRVVIGQGVTAQSETNASQSARPAVVIKQSPRVISSKTIGRSFDQQRVTSAGEKAFAPEVIGSDELPRQKALPGRVNSLITSRDSIGHETSADDRFHAASTVLAGGGDLLATHELPSISSRVSGPKQILIGREATFEVRFDNQSNVAAHEVIAQVDIPSWADVVDTAASNGVIQQTEVTEQFNTYRWQLQELGGRGSETLKLKVVPRASRALKLGVHWSHAAVDSEAVVEVQQPKLRMQVSGPNEVFFNTPEVYRLTLSNPGTGVAEEVYINLLPPAGGDESLSTHQIGELQPGASKTVEVELTPREAGKLFVKATASALGGITAEAEKDIFCRKPELEVDWRGSVQKYAGTIATYYFRVRNPGTAAADDVEVEVRLPGGAEFVSGSEGHVVDRAKPTLTWQVGSLLPGDDRYMELKCILNNAGTNRFAVTAATAEGDLTDTKSAEINVIALADLKLDVTDPKGPIPVGQEAVYEISVRNRGQNTAEEVDVVALFSEGIDAQTVEGAQYSVADGRVTFPTIEKLEAGQQIVLKIHARATQPGVHVFRAEVLCRDLEIKLAVEEATRFFADEVPGKSTEQKSAGAFESYDDPRY
jgi:uncharacterized repeat protein (TIGR01451 family)